MTTTQNQPSRPHRIKIEVASVPILIEYRHDAIRGLCRGYETDKTPVLCIGADAQTMEKARHAERDGDRMAAATAESVSLYRRLCEALLDRDVLMLHAAAVTLSGHAYLFSAPSGTGKSTHAALWVKAFGATVLNGDKPLLAVKPTGVTAYGTPWRGKENWGINASAPVRALCFLSRGETDEVHPATPREAVCHLLPQLLRQSDPALREKQMVLAERLLRTVPVCLCACTPTEHAAAVTRDYMTRC